MRCRLRRNISLIAIVIIGTCMLLFYSRKISKSKRTFHTRFHQNKHRTRSKDLVLGLPMSDSSSPDIMLKIDKEWNSKPLPHPSIHLALKWQQGDSYVTFEVDAPFFDDPPAPNGPAGKPFPQLWDYEVVEIFFLGADDKYLEVEVSPHGQHLLLMLNGTRNMVKDELDMDYTASIDRSQSSWKGTAKIPLSYFPKGTNKLNAYAIHGSGNSRLYESLYPAPEGKHENPDFHRLEYFQVFDFNGLVKDQSGVGKYWDSL